MVDLPLSISIAEADDASLVDLEVSLVAEDATESPERLFDGRVEQATESAPPSAVGARTEDETSAQSDALGGPRQRASSEQDEPQLAGHSGAIPSEHARQPRPARGETTPAWRGSPTAPAAGVRVLGALNGVRETAAALGVRVLGGAGAVHVLGGVPLQAVVGLGAWAELSADTLRRAAAHAVVYATDLRRATLAINVPETLPPSIALDAAVQAMAEGALLAADARQPRATVTPRSDTALPPRRCVLRLPRVRAPDADIVAPELRPGCADSVAAALPTVGDAPGLRQGGSHAMAEAAISPRRPAAASGAVQAAVLRRAQSHAAAVSLARQLADTPANRMSPRQLADQAALAVHALGLSSEILGATELEELGAGLLLAVGAGSARPPALGILRYAPPRAARHVAVVGKGITFDAGGINVKPAKGMADMVHDKAGAADAAAIAFGAALLELPIAVTALLACAENLPSGAAYRPGDVLQGMDGATVEVVDTDAEGRLVLADALTYAVRLTEPRPVDVMIDLATLTGSIVSALGNEAAGLFSNDDVLAARMLEAASAAGEPLWRMPILAGHRAQLKSERADRKQCADRWGDCAIAAAFLEMYVDKRPWLHLDIAGVAYHESSLEWPPYHPKTGAGGTGVRTVLHFLEALSAQAPDAS
jgi:leucyl aminopeptidase